MGKALELIGKVFGRLTIISKAGQLTTNAIRWNATCSCGSTTIVTSNKLSMGHTKSCGCLNSDKRLKNLTYRGGGKPTHGYSGNDTPEYHTWKSMRGRCNRVTDKSYENYGGRGIGICDEWNDFQRFFSDMGPKPTPHHSIDRINNNKGYSKDNCRWATSIMQMNNTRRSRLVNYNGKVFTTAEVAKMTGVRSCTIRYRMDKGLSIDEAVSLPLHSVYKLCPGSVI